MFIDIKNAVEKYKKSTISDSINEAIVNSIQANATKIEIEINSSSDLGGELISSVKIKDNGDGFNSINRNSFYEYQTAYKKSKGCKGIGRISYLKTFQRVRISSKQNCELVEFDFNEKFNDKCLEPKPIKENIKETILEMSEPKINAKFDIDKIYSEIYNHIFYFLFFNEKDCEIIINNKPPITKENVNELNPINFKITKEIDGEKFDADFTMWYRFKKSDKAILDDFICINNRPTKRFSDRPLKINLNKRKDHQITFLLESKWIDQQSDDYHNINSGDLVDPIGWEDVKEKLLIEISKILDANFPDLKLENNKKINELKDRYPHYADYIQNPNLGFIDEKQILDEAYKQSRKQEEKLESSNISIDDIKKCVSNDLIRYILHRQKIIDKLSELSINKERLEKNIHDLILKKGIEGFDYSPVKIEENNIWLIDDKFMTYAYVASNKQIQTILPNCGLEGDSQDAPDIAIYVPNKDGIKKMVLIELKKFTATDYDNGKGVMQLRNYSKLITDSGASEAYLYLLAEIDNNDFRGQLNDTFNFKKIFSQEGEIWQGKFGNIPAYVQIVSPDAIIADANARNKTFLDIIKTKK